MTDRAKVIKGLLAQGLLPTEENINRLLGVQEDEKEPTKRESEQDKVTILNTKGDIDLKVKVLREVLYKPSKINVKDFSKYFKNRYKTIRNILLNRQDTKDAVSISLARDQSGERMTIIGMVSDIVKMSTGSVKLVMEDTTGQMSAIISAKKDKLVEDASMLTYDEVIAVIGMVGKNTLFVDEIIWPDIPKLDVEPCPDDVYAAFTGDIHAGSNMFLPNELQSFIDWLNGKVGDKKQKEIAKKTKYVFVLGDVVDGVGIYPNQDSELHVTDIYKQYELAAKFLKQIPEDKQIIICPGNHDAMRIAEPQPRLYEDYAAAIYDLPNVINVSNPALVSIHQLKNYSGTKVQLYHGYSFDYFLDKVEGLRLAGGYERPDKLIEFLLKRRHLAPSHGSTLAIPIENDPNVIREVPDIFATGHIHKAKIAKYKNVLTIGASCWQKNTSFQDKVGLKSEPAKVPIINLKTKEGKLLSFD